MTTETFTVTDYSDFKQKMLNWANRFNIFCFLDNNHYSFDEPAFECILAAGARRSITLEPGKSFNALKRFYDARPSWLFGHLGYGLKNEVEDLSSRNTDFIDFGIGFFFEPEILLTLKGNELSVSSDTADLQQVVKAIDQFPAAEEINSFPVAGIQAAITKVQYIEAVNSLRQHIRRGDCYEINFCQQFFAEKTSVDILQIYHQLSGLSPNPFGAFYKLDEKYCVCASPERYLKKTGNQIISQPVKGTSKRNFADHQTDEDNKNHLLTSRKEQSENVMIVDLVRNDLSRICKEGSVEVEELFGIYSFPQVHQMISTVKGEVDPGLHWTEAVKATFPMGSMTGAPKKRVMQLIDQYESTSRGLFSGSIGYVTPAADFDFNVVIRSLFYDDAEKKLSFSAGGGITFSSIPEDEYHESLLKASTIRKILDGKNEIKED